MVLVVLDFLPEGAPSPLPPGLERALMRRGIRIRRGSFLVKPIAFLFDKKTHALLLGIPKRPLEIGEEITNEELEAWHRVWLNEITTVAREELERTLDKLVEEKEQEFVAFFNTCGPITTRLHRLELLPGIGKKHMWKILEERRKPFSSYEDLKKRVPLLPDPRKIIKERILMELEGNEKYYLFVPPPRYR